MTQTYIPALKHRFLTPFYDVLVRLTFPERRAKDRLLEDASPRRGDQMLDVGCGTGTLLLLAKRLEPDAHFVGVDPDPEILAIARRKMSRFGFDIRFDIGSATALPYDDNSFDHVLSSLVIHHLRRDEKARAFREILRVLRPGGTFHLADFGAPHNRALRIASWLVERIGREHVQENFRGELPAMLSDAGFASVKVVARFSTLFGAVDLLRGERSAEGIPGGLAC